jgi:hypothetical protein
MSRKDSRRRAYFASLGAYVPLAERYVAADDGPPSRARFYRVDVQRDGAWHKVGEFGDVGVASNYAQAVRDNVNARAIAPSAANTRVVHCKTPQREDLLPPLPPAQKHPNSAARTELRPIGIIADRTDGARGLEPKEIEADRAARGARWSIAMLQIGLRTLCVPGAAAALAIGRGMRGLNRGSGRRRVRATRAGRMASTAMELA